MSTNQSRTPHPRIGTRQPEPTRTGTRPPALLLDSGGVLILLDGEVLAHHGKRLGLRLDAVTAQHAVALAARDQDLEDEPASGPRPFTHRWAEHMRLLTRRRRSTVAHRATRSGRHSAVECRQP